MTNDDITKGPATAKERADEQDLAADGRANRSIDIGGGKRSTASVSLRRRNQSSGAIAYLRYKVGPKQTLNLSLGIIEAASRNEALRESWRRAKEKGLLDRDDETDQ